MDEVRSINIEDKDYPESLRKIPDAPKILYYRGNFVAQESRFAVVGTRRPSPYGQQVTLQLAGELADAGLTIISGMAPGIDTFAHKICVEKGQRTIAVLGTGLDEKSIYPQQNIPLSKKIIETGGCLISELPPDSHGSKFTFPRRNRIIAGLSLGVLVVEAKEKSGSLITAQYAKEQKKEIFAVPGSIFSLNSRGPNNLIKNGAHLVESANDILGELGLSPQKIQKEFFAENKEENLILMALTEEPIHIDRMIEKTKLPVNLVATTLALMEISGTIRNLGGNVYAIA